MASEEEKELTQDERLRDLRHLLLEEDHHLRHLRHLRDDFLREHLERLRRLHHHLRDERLHELLDEHLHDLHELLDEEDEHLHRRHLRHERLLLLHHLERLHELLDHLERELDLPLQLARPLQRALLKLRTQEQQDCEVVVTSNFGDEFLPLLHSSYIQTSVIDGLKDEVVAWKEMGISIHVPAGVVSPGDQCEIVIVPVFSGDFIFPEGATLVSGVFAISTSHQILSPVTIQLEHCVDLSEGDEKMMKFAKADHVKSRPSPNHFKVCDGGVFMTGSKIGTLECQTFSYIVQFAIGRLKRRYKAQVFLDSQNWIAYIAVFMDVQYFAEKASDDFMKLGGFQKQGNECFTFAANNIVFKTDEVSDDHLWKITPHSCEIEKRDVNLFLSPTQYKCFHLIPESGCSKWLLHEVRIQGATKHDLKLTFSCPPPRSGTTVSVSATQFENRGLEEDTDRTDSVTTSHLPRPLTDLDMHDSHPVSARPTVQELCIELRDLVDWEETVIQLPAMSNAEVNKVTRNDRNVDQHKREAFDTWLRRCPEASWSHIRDALQKAGEFNLEKMVATKHCLPLQAEYSQTNAATENVVTTTTSHWSKPQSIPILSPSPVATVEASTIRDKPHTPLTAVDQPLEDYPDSTPHTVIESSDEEIDHK